MHFDPHLTQHTHCGRCFDDSKKKKKMRFSLKNFRYRMHSRYVSFAAAFLWRMIPTVGNCFFFEIERLGDCHHHHHHHHRYCRHHEKNIGSTFSPTLVQAWRSVLFTSSRRSLWVWSSIITRITTSSSHDWCVGKNDSCGDCGVRVLCRHGCASRMYCWEWGEASHSVHWFPSSYAWICIDSGTNIMYYHSKNKV